MHKKTVLLNQDTVKPDFTAIGQQPDQIPVHCGSVAIVTLIISLSRREVY